MRHSSRSSTTLRDTGFHAFLNFVNSCKNFVASRHASSEVGLRLRAVLALAVVCGASFAFVAGASADINGVVTAWGYNGDGECNIPASAKSGVSAIAGGAYHTIALKDGAVLAWGSNSDGQCNIPASANSGVSAIAGGGFHTIALKNGAVMAWGYNSYGQCNIPASSGVSAIAGGDELTIALKNGEVLAWGNNRWGQCYIPVAAQSGVIAIACGGEHIIALKNGAVKAWGRNYNSQCDIPVSASSGVSAIAGFGDYTIALKNGAVLAWGSNDYGQCNIPASASIGVTAIAGGYYHTIALDNVKDCNNNGIHDALDVAAGSTDLNQDLVPDTCQGAIEYASTSASLGVPTANIAVSTTFTNLVMPDNFADVPVVISAKGDFDASNEYLTVKLNGVTMQRVFESGGVNCATGAGAGISTATVQIPFATFANAVAVGQLTITLLPSPAVTASECGTGYMTAQLKYVGIGASGDCNNNGLLDTRDIGANPSLDRDRNALLDACELAGNPLLDCNLNGELDVYDIAMGAPDDDLDTHPDQCQYDKGDLDLSGIVDSGDFSILLLYYGEVNPPFGDFDGSGIIDTGDASIMLLNFGDVTWP